MIDIMILFMLLLCHFVGDFCWQSRRIAETKSKSVKSLMTHSVFYGIAFIATVMYNPWFMVATVCFHFVIDGITSQLTSYFYKKGDNHNFFCVIGFDQMLHIIILVLTWKAMIC